jgi:hypothetical protein
MDKFILRRRNKNEKTPLIKVTHNQRESSFKKAIVLGIGTPDDDDDCQILCQGTMSVLDVLVLREMFNKVMEKLTDEMDKGVSEHLMSLLTRGLNDEL